MLCTKDNKVSAVCSDVSPDSGCPSTVRQHGPRMLGPLARPLAPCLLVLAGGQGLAPPLAAAAQGPGVPAAGAGSPALLASAPAPYQDMQTCN